MVIMIGTEKLRSSIFPALLSNKKYLEDIYIRYVYVLREEYEMNQRLK